MNTHYRRFHADRVVEFPDVFEPGKTEIMLKRDFMEGDFPDPIAEFTAVYGVTDDGISVCLGDFPDKKEALLFMEKLTVANTVSIRH